MPDLGGGIRDAESREFKLSLPVLPKCYRTGFRPVDRKELEIIRDAVGALLQVVKELAPEASLSVRQQDVLKRSPKDHSVYGLSELTQQVKEIFVEHVFVPLTQRKSSDPEIAESGQKFLNLVSATSDLVSRAVEGYSEEGYDIYGESSLVTLKELARSLKQSGRKDALKIRNQLT